MTFKVTDGEGIQALYQNRVEFQSDGWAVTDRANGSCKVSINTGDFGSDNEALTVAAGTALINGSEMDIAEQTVDVPEPGSSPRKDVVILDEFGEAGLIAGTAEAKSPSGSPLETAERPAPPDLSTMDVVPLAIVLVYEGATSLVSDDLIDIRASGDLTAGEVSAHVASLLDQLDIPVYDNDPDAPVETLYWYSPEDLLKYKDADGVVHEAGGAVALSELSIDTAKNWNGYGISNIGSLEVSGDITTGGDSVATDPDLNDHTSDTTNPHDVTNDQVSAPSQTEFDSHIGDTSNPHSVTADQTNALPNSGGTVTGDVTIDGDLTVTEAHHLETIRDASDFTGADGGEQIQAAIDDLPAEGGMVYVPAEGPDTNGRWDVSSPIVPASNVNLIGVPGATRLYLASGTDNDLIQTDVDTASAAKENIVIEGFSLEGNSANNDGSISETYISKSCGIRLLNATDTVVRNCTVDDFAKHGLEVKRSQHVVIEGCIASNNADDGISISDVLFDTADTEDVTVRECRATANADNGFEVDDGPVHVQIEGCYSHANATNGFTIHTHTSDMAPAAPQNISIINCDSVNNDRLGYAIGHHKSGTPKDYFLRGVTATGNRESPLRSEITEASDETVPLGNVVVDEFYFEGANIQDTNTGYTAGIKLDKATPWNDLTISNGIITGTLGYGIFLRDATIDGLTVDNVVIEGSGIDSYLVFGSMEDNGNVINDFQFSNCVFKNGPKGGLAFNPGSTDVFRDGQITDNVCKNNNQRGSSGMLYSGIVFGDSGTMEHISVEGNACYDDDAGTQEYGIYRGDGADYCTYVGNTTHGNAQSGFGGGLGTNSKETANII